MSDARAGERAFRLLLRLYPAAFRARFEDEMVDFYRARRDEQQHRHGARGTARLWLHLIADVALSAPRERVLSWRRAPAPEFPWASPDYPPEIQPMDTLLQDFRYAVRALIRQPSFAIVSGLTLALGIGATTAIFSVVDAVLLRPLPWPDGDRIVALFETRGNDRFSSVAYPNFLDWRAENSTFEELGVLRGQSVNLTGTDAPDRLTGQFVTAGMLRVLGATALQGRLFTDAETDVATKEPVTVVSEATWRTRFGSKPDLIGSTLILNGQPLVVIGIMRPGFTTPWGTPDAWLPMGYFPNRGALDSRQSGDVAVFGKLKPDATIERATSDLDAIAKRLAAAYPATNAGVGVNVQNLKEQIVGDARTPLLVVLASVATVLLIACANVANLQLARAAARRRELSVRAALGAGPRRLMRQLLTESLVLSLVGGLAGLGIAYAGTRWFSSVVPNLLVLFGDIVLDRGVLAFAALVTIATGIVFGIAPAWRASRARVQDTLTVRSDSGTVRLRAHHALVIGQMALCVVLLVSAALLTRSLMALTQVRPGFDVEGLLTMQFRLPASRYDSDEKIATMFARTVAEIRSVPGVQSAALVRATPLNGNGETVAFRTERTAGVEAGKLPAAHRNIVTPGYFETMRIPRVTGRDFASTDAATSMPVAIVNAQLASKLDPGGNAVGKRLQLGTDSTWYTIVGVVGNTKHFRLNEVQLDQVYVPHAQLPLIFTEVVVRTSGDPMSLANAVRAAIWRVDRDQPVWRIRPVAVSIDNQLGSRRFIMRLLGSFAILAVVLAMIGVYGVMSYAVTRRTQEVGVRMALGARHDQVVGMILRQGLRTVAIAISIGVAVSLWATRALETQLFGVRPTDPWTFAIVPLGLALVALAACYLPARRASRIDPIVALRTD